MDLGLSSQDRTKLLDTNVIFHGTSIVRSNQKLRTMTNINVRSTMQMLLLAREMRDLKVSSIISRRICGRDRKVTRSLLQAFVHLSTVFAQSPLVSIDEIHYPPPVGTDNLLSLMNILPDKKLDNITPK